MARGRPRKTDPETVLNAAMELFWDRGFERTSMNDLVEHTGMAKPGLYATFGDKETIYTKALKHYFENLGGPLLQDLSKSADPIDVVLRRVLEAVAVSATKKENPRGCFVANSVVECSGQRSILERLGRTYDQARRSAFKERFQTAKDQTEIPADSDVNALAEFFAGQTLAIAVMARAGADLETLKQFIDVAMTALPVRSQKAIQA